MNPKPIDSKQLSKIRKLLVNGNPEGVALAIQLLTTLEASEEQWLKLFNKTRLSALIRTRDPQIWTKLAESATSRPRLHQAILAGSKASGNGIAVESLFLTDHHDVMRLAVEILKGSSLYLGGLTTLSDAAAESLSKHEGALLLQGVAKAAVNRARKRVGSRQKPAKSSKPAPASKTGSVAKKERYFEFKDKQSSKFWEIRVQGCDVTVRFGKIGVSGQTQSKSFPDQAMAEAHAGRLITEKTKKGYKETPSA